MRGVRALIINQLCGQPCFHSLSPQCVDGGQVGRPKPVMATTMVEGLVQGAHRQRSAHLKQPLEDGVIGFRERGTDEIIVGLPLTSDHALHLLYLGLGLQQAVQASQATTIDSLICRCDAWPGMIAHRVEAMRCLR